MYADGPLGVDPYRLSPPKSLVRPQPVKVTFLLAFDAPVVPDLSALDSFGLTLGLWDGRTEDETVRKESTPASRERHRGAGMFNSANHLLSL